MKLKKCYFFSNAMNYLGHVITPGRLHMETKTMETIGTLRYSINTTEQQAFVDLCNVYRRFVSDFVRKGAPLDKPLKNGNRRNWARTEKERPRWKN